MVCLSFKKSRGTYFKRIMYLKIEISLMKCLIIWSRWLKYFYFINIDFIIFLLSNFVLKYLEIPVIPQNDKSLNLKKKTKISHFCCIFCCKCNCISICVTGSSCRNQQSRVLCVTWMDSFSRAGVLKNNWYPPRIPDLSLSTNNNILTFTSSISKIAPKLSIAS